MENIEFLEDPKQKGVFRVSLVRSKEAAPPRHKSCTPFLYKKDTDKETKK